MSGRIKDVRVGGEFVRNLKKNVKKKNFKKKAKKKTAILSTTGEIWTCGKKIGK
jgi:hypothetical protein